MAGLVPEDPTPTDIAKEAMKAFSELGSQFQSAFAKHLDEAQYKLDLELGKQLAKHPELYAELKKGYRGLRRGMDDVAKSLGLK